MTLREQYNKVLTMTGVARFEAFRALMKRMDDIYTKHFHEFPRNAYGNLMHNCRGNSPNMEYWTKKIEAHDELIGLRSGKPIHPEALDKAVAAWDKEYVDNCESAVTLCEPFEEPTL